MIWTLVHFGIMLHRMLSLIFFVSQFLGPFWHRIWLLLTRFRLLFSFFFAGYESWNKSSWKEKYFFTSIGLFFRRNFLDVEKGIKWYEIKLDRGSLLQVRRVLFLVEIAHDVTVLQWTNLSFLSCRIKYTTSSWCAIIQYDLIVQNEIFQIIRVLSTDMYLKFLDKWQKIRQLQKLSF